MATYNFETITAAQALGFNGALDTLVFTSPIQTGSSERLLFNTDGTITVFSNVGGLKVTFGPGLVGAGQIVYPDGSEMLVGSPGGDVLTGGARGDGLFGGFGNDTLIGGPGDDALQGGPGADVLTGGGGRDLFLFDHDSPPVVGQMDTITDWQSTDGLSFFLGPTAPSSYVEGTAADFSSAKAFANAQLASGTVEYVAEQVGADVIVFAGSFGNQGPAADAVILAGRTLADIDASNIVTSGDFPSVPPPVGSPPPPPPVSPPPPPVSPPPPPPPAPAHGATAIIGGDPDISQVQNLLDNGVATFSSTSLSLQGGGSSFTLTGFGFTLDADENLTGGTLTGIDLNLVGGPHLHVTGLETPIVPLVEQIGPDDRLAQIIFSGDDLIVSDAASSTIHGYFGRDTLQAAGGSAYLFGDDGDDSLSGSAGADHLVGGPGADTMAGGGGADVFTIGPSDSTAFLAAGGHLEKLDHIIDWTSSDFLQLNSLGVATPANYQEIVATSFDQAYDIAKADVAQGIYVVAAQIGSDVVVFEAANANAVVLQGRTLADISQANVGGDPALAQPDPGSPPPPPTGGTTTVGNVQTGTAGPDQMIATASASEVHAGAGNDTIIGAAVQDYLRGDDGDDSISGGAAFDDANGNMGNDTIHGNGGDDYSVGGKGDDLLFGDDGDDIVWGNLGNDTCDGGNGADQCRGGQGDDSISGGAGNDFISGDRGNDTESGGPGADIFHTFSGAGIDKVLDFNQAEGDRVMLDPGTAFTVHQVGADTVIDMGNGDQMILVGVQMSTLTPGWIFGA